MDRNVIERRQPKLTEKGKAYRLNERKRERNQLKREIQSRIANIGTLMGLNKNLELDSKESVKLNECLKSLVIFMRRYKNFSVKKNKYLTFKCMTTCILK